MHLLGRVARRTSRRLPGVTTLLLVRHGRTTANGAGVLAGWTEGVSLDDAGRDQVTALAQRLVVPGRDVGVGRGGLNG
jgi:hypothetical protein